MKKNFKSAFKDFINDRAFEICNDILIDDDNYNKLTNECITLYNTIRDNLPQDIKYLIDDYESSASLIDGIILEVMYNRGFMDGIEFTNYIHANIQSVPLEK